MMTMACALLPYRFGYRKREQFPNVLPQSLDLHEHSRHHCPPDGVQVQNQHFDEQPFFVPYGFLSQIHVVFQDARQLRPFVELAPDVPVFLVGGYEIADSPRPLIPAGRIDGKKQAGDDAGALNQIEPMVSNPLRRLHAGIIPENVALPQPPYAPRTRSLN